MSKVIIPVFAGMDFALALAGPAVAVGAGGCGAPQISQTAEGDGSSPAPPETVVTQDKKG